MDNSSILYKHYWIDKTCEDCIYNIDNKCRKHPPIHKYMLFSGYPIISEISDKELILSGGKTHKYLYQDACSFYEKGDK